MITSRGKEPSTRKGKKLDKLAVEWSVDPKDLREVDRQAIPIVLISDGGKSFFPTKYQSTQTYTKYKLQLVANLAANCLSESNTIDIRVLEDDIKEPFTNLKTSIRQFLRSHPAQVADPASAGTKVVQRVKGAVVPSILQNPPSPQKSIQENPVPVPPCPEPFVPLQSKKKKPPKLHQCPQCGVTKSKTNDLKDHIQSVHGEGYICNEGACTNKKFTQKKNLKAHQKQYHQGEYKYVCQERKCKFKTKEKEVYEAHKIRKYGQQVIESFTCDKCSKKFNAKYLLRKYLKYGMCNVTPNFICDVCVPSKKFKTSQRLILHNKYVHSSKTQKVKCKLCYKLFSSRENLKRHTKRHYEQEEKVKKQKEAEAAEAAKAKNKKPKKVRFKVQSTKSAPAKLVKH